MLLWAKHSINNSLLNLTELLLGLMIGTSAPTNPFWIIHGVHLFNFSKASSLSLISLRSLLPSYRELIHQSVSMLGDTREISNDLIWRHEMVISIVLRMAFLFVFIESNAGQNRFSLWLYNGDPVFRSFLLHFSFILRYFVWWTITQFSWGYWVLQCNFQNLWKMLFWTLI
jgi:hypothetical protein